MDEQLRTQDAVAQRMRVRRRAMGSLDFETFQPRAVFEGERVVGIHQQVQNRARQLIEEFARSPPTRVRRGFGPAWLQCPAPRGAFARTLAADRAGGCQVRHRAALHARFTCAGRFLARQRKADPLRFPDLSLVIVKLMGSGEYVVEHARGEPIGHFGLAVRDYIALHGAQPPLSRPHHPAHGQGRAGRVALAPWAG